MFSKNLGAGPMFQNVSWDSYMSGAHSQTNTHAHMKPAR
jgi:hypothetical protein